MSVRTHSALGIGSLGAAPLAAAALKASALKASPAALLTKPVAAPVSVKEMLVTPPPPAPVVAASALKVSTPVIAPLKASPAAAPAAPAAVSVSKLFGDSAPAAVTAFRANTFAPEGYAEEEIVEEVDRSTVGASVEAPNGVWYILAAAGVAFVGYRFWKSRKAAA